MSHKRRIAVSHDTAILLVVKCIQGCDYLLIHKDKSSFLIMQTFMQKTILDFPCFVYPIRLATNDKVGHLGESWREL